MAFLLPDAAYAVPQAITPTQPFVWGQGGARVSPDQIARQREMAQSQLASGMDYSPVQSPWQGAARFAQAITGALGMKKADKEAAANQSASDAITQELLKGNESSGNAVAAALLDPNTSPEARQFAVMQWKDAHRAPAAQHFFEANNGDEGAIDPVTGQVNILWHDPTPKMNFIPDGMGGGQWVAVPTGAASAGNLPTAPVGKLTPIDGGAGPSQAPRMFPLR